MISATPMPLPTSPDALRDLELVIRSADQIGWFCDHLPGRKHVTISVQPTMIMAAAELAVMAG